ncbi:MAG: hypothetical protein IPL53_09220 [Ignavibacteria bacterium]|nr:hypothetical protein [Ignavibacteria bacterium]
MTTKELKYKLLEDIGVINDEKLLTLIKTMIDNYRQSSIEISEDRKKILDIAKQQIKDNNYFTNEEINREEEGWLKE